MSIKPAASLLSNKTKSILLRFNRAFKQSFNVGGNRPIDHAIICVINRSAYLHALGVFPSSFIAVSVTLLDVNLNMIKFSGMVSDVYFRTAGLLVLAAVLVSCSASPYLENGESKFFFLV